MTVDTMTIQRYKAGTGLHYINDNFLVFHDGTYQFGDTSDTCILTNASLVLSYYGLPQLWNVWNSVYPDDPVDQEDTDFFIEQSLPFMEKCDPSVDPRLFSLILSRFITIKWHPI